MESRKDQLLVKDVRDGWEPLLKFLKKKARPRAPYPSEHDNFLPLSNYGAIESQNLERHRHFVGEQGHDQRVVMEFRHCICCRCSIHWFRCRRVAFSHWRHRLLNFVVVHLIISFGMVVKDVVRRMPLTQALPSALGMIFVAVAMNRVFLVGS